MHRDSHEEHRSPSRRALSRGFRQLAIPAVVTVGAFLLLGAGLPWPKTFTPHWMIIRGGIVLLWFLLGAFIFAVPAAAIGMVWSWIGGALSTKTRSCRVRAVDQVAAAVHELFGVLDPDGSRCEDNGSTFLPDPGPAIEQEERGGQSWSQVLSRRSQHSRANPPGGTRQGRGIERSRAILRSHRAGPS